jgi:hypothetical protein
MLVPPEVFDEDYLYFYDEPDSGRSDCSAPGAGSSSPRDRG